MYHADIQSCLDSLLGPDSTEKLVSITTEGKEFFRPITLSITRQNFRTLRVDWMYESTDFLWLNDEV